MKMPLTLRLTVLTCLASVMHAHCLAQTPKKPADGTNTADVGVASGTPQVVLSGFFRIHHPEFLLEVARRVKSGQTSKLDLDRFAGPNMSALLLKSNLNKVPGAGQGGVKLSLTTLSKLLDLPTQLSKNDYSPSKIEYDSMIPAEQEQTSVSFTSPIEGVVTAAVASLPNVFQIQRMQTLAGEAFFGPSGIIEAPYQTSTTGTIPILSGQRMVLDMKVGPVQEGTYNTSLNVTCKGYETSWQVSIPLKIVVSKSNEYRAVHQGFNPQGLAFPGRPFDIHVSLTPVNYRVPFAATITSICPSGITAQPTKVEFDSKATVNAVIHCQCAANAQMQDNQIMGCMITADNQQKTLFWPQIDIAPYQAIFKFHSMSSGFHAAPLSSDPSFNMTWENPEVLVDGDGNFTCLGTVAGYPTGPYQANTAQTGNGHLFYVPFGIYFTDFHGVKQGSYNVAVGNANWIRTNWTDIVSGRLKAGAWFDPGGLFKYDWPHMVPLVNGKFTLPGGQSNITVQAWNH